MISPPATRRNHDCALRTPLPASLEAARDGILILARYSASFDPYPYILLNLFLSMLAAVQAPVILMSQNRQRVKDRLNAAHDCEVNLKAELEILSRMKS